MPRREARGSHVRLLACSTRTSRLLERRGVQPDDVLVRANYSANADIVLDRRDKALAINESFVQFEGEKPFVEVEVAPQRFERREIETGLSDGIHIEVVRGLTEQDRIKDPNPSRSPAAS